ncbi:MAG: hypothetical protein CL942_05835 [Desulfovibrio sp.]|nr:hypothetical protein [Desulfovibrio sp.]|tara:strand:+ start:2127 stop:2588 length:462 start_codon:yes stop_codon:yes gene_type:complete
MDVTDSWDIAEHWYELLLDCIPVNEFCVASFGRKPELFLSFDERDAAGKQQTPFVVVEPMSDRDGIDIPHGTHAVLVALGIKDDSIQHDDQGRGVRTLGFKVLKEFEGVVRQAFMAGRYPLSDWQAENSHPGRHYFERHVFFTVNLPNTLGLT